MTNFFVMSTKFFVIRSGPGFDKLDRVPKFSDGWMPVRDALRAGNFFLTSGETLMHDQSPQGAGATKTFIADVDWTYHRNM